MPIPANYIPIFGSERTPLSDSIAIGAAEPSELMQVTVVLRPKLLDAAAAPQVDHRKLPHDRKYLTLTEYESAYSAAENDIELVRQFSASNNVAVANVNPVCRSIKLSGRVTDFERAFAVELQQYEYPSGAYRGRVGPVLIPRSLEGVVQGVFGLDNRPAVEPRSHWIRTDLLTRLGRTRAVPTPIPLAGSFPTIPELARFYAFPPGDGSGQTIGIIALGGGIVFSDLPVFFKGLGLRQPQVNTVSIDGGASNPNQNDGGFTLEVMQDIEVAGAVAPGSNIVVYFAQNTEESFLNAVLGAVFDPINSPSAISISWGHSEALATLSAMRVMDQAFQEAAMLGRTVLCASGDNGSSERATDNRAHVVFPASSPNALACGGTSLTASTIAGVIASEVVWENGPGSNSGGGISDVFALPSYQDGAEIPNSANPTHNRGRGVPDVSGHAASAKMFAFGQENVAAGTSMVAPLWAGLVALLNENLGKRVGFMHPQLYQNPQVQRDITSGSNGAYQARPGWDACTGLGSPNGVALLQALRGFLLNTGTPITEADAGNFRFSAGDFDQDGISDLFCVRVSNTGTHSMEVHILNGADDFQSFLLQTGTPISEVDAANFQFVVGDFNADGIPDLYCLRVSNTGTNSLEVHILNGADNFQSFLLRIGTPIVEADSRHFQFALGDFNRDGILDLYCVKLAGAGTNSLELHVLNGKDHFQSFLLQTGTSITSAEAPNYGFFASADFNQDGIDDLYCIKVRDTGTKSLEVHILNGADNFRSFLLETGTAIPQVDAGNFQFALGHFSRNALHLPDLYCEKVSTTGTNSLEVHILNGVMF